MLKHLRAKHKTLNHTSVNRKGTGRKHGYAIPAPYAAVSAEIVLAAYIAGRTGNNLLCAAEAAARLNGFPAFVSLSRRDPVHRHTRSVGNHVF